jgi:hypothetical protein
LEESFFVNFPSDPNLFNPESEDVKTPGISQFKMWISNNPFFHLPGQCDMMSCFLSVRRTILLVIQSLSALNRGPMEYPIANH